MNLSGKAVKLKIIIGESDTVYQRPLYEAIVFAAKKYKISGVTVVKGIMNYGAIEMIDRPERLIDFAAIASRLLDKAEAGGLITLEEVDVLHYGTTSSFPASS